jgi:predicted nucleotidyltransferase
MAARPSRSRARRRARTSPTPEPALTRELRGIIAALTAGDADFALVGGLAVSARAEPRLTRDVDIAVAVHDDREAEAVVRDLTARGYKLDSTVEQTRTKRLATARLTRSDEALLVDLLFASCGVEPEIVRDATRIELLPRLVVPVASTAHLVAMKLLASDDRNRPQDEDDLRALVPLLDAAGRKRVTAALALIERRGYARGRDLRAMWRARLKTAGQRRPR